MSIYSLNTDNFIDIASFCFQGAELTQKDMSLLSTVCSLWRNQFVREICSRELGKKTNLTLREVEIYRKRLSSSDPADWDCVLKYCKQLNKIDFSSPAYYIGSPPMENGKLRKISSLDKCELETIINSIKTNCLNIQYFNLAGNPKIDAFKCIQNSFPKLVTLNVTRGPLFNYPLSCEKVRSILKQYDQLSELDVTGQLTGKEIIILKNEFPNVSIIDKVFDFESEYC